MMISKFHNNNQAHNWVIYKSLDRFLEKNANLLKGNVYDLGCGTGVYKNYIKSIGANYVGVDWSNTIHNSAAEIVSDLNDKFTIESNSADAILSISVIEHLHNPQGFLNESYRILKSEGNILLQCPWQWRIHEAPHDYFRYTTYALRMMFEKAGFTDIKIYPSTGLFTTLVLKWNYFLLRFVKGPKPIKFLIKLLLLPVWTIGQLLSPLLDKLDNNWDLETQGYFIIAKKK